MSMLLNCASVRRNAGSRATRRHRFSAIALGVAALLAGTAQAQETAISSKENDKKAATDLDKVVVKGVRASVTKAQAIKQNAEQFVDSIVAEDIGKLPDNNVAEALQRISGIQIDRNYGEGSNIAIRGLTQVRTELNGRDIFTANDGRGLSFEDVSAELMAGVDVYKNPSADMIEGGIGGTVDLRTRKPFDYDGMKLAGSVQYNYYDLVEKGETAFSGMFSDRWQTGIGEIGLLVNVSKQNGSFRQDTISVEPWYAQTNVPGYEGQTVYVPHGIGIDTTFGDRKRQTGAIALQWRPNEDVEVYLQAMRSDYDFRWRDYSFFAYTGSDTVETDPNSEFVVNDANEFVKGTFLGVPIDSNTSLTTRHSITTDYSGGAIWHVNDRLKLSTDFQYVVAKTKSDRYIVSTGTWGYDGSHLNVDLSSGLPTITMTGANGETDYLTNLNNYAGWKWHLDNIDDNHATEFAWRSDMELSFDSDFFRSFKAGLRYTNRNARNMGNVWRWMAIYQSYDSIPGGEVVLNPFSNFFRGDTVAFGPSYAASDAMVADYENTLKLFGGTPLTYAPNNINVQGENTYAAYAVLRFGVDDGPVPFDGNIGARLVRTEVSTAGVMTDPTGTGALLPIDVRHAYNDVLPSLNLRWFLRDNLQWRFAVSKAISRPTFDKLNPNLSLSTGTNETGDITSRTGSAGNPDLKPMTAKQFDTSLEWYFGKGSMLYGTVFYKKVKDFIASGTFNEFYQDADGVAQEYEVTRPVNGDKGTIKGAEVGYTQFFDFLPGWLSGFGLQTNYTYVDSKAPSPNATDTDGNPLIVPLEGLSKNSYNVILSYEKSKFQARVAYNWRSDWLVTTAGNGTGNLPIYAKAYGQLDASLRYNINDVWSVSLDGVNLLDTRYESYQGTESRYRDWHIGDRRFGITLRASL